MNAGELQRIQTLGTWAQLERVQLERESQEAGNEEPGNKTMLRNLDFIQQAVGIAERIQKQERMICSQLHFR